MKIKIYQISPELDSHNLMFMNLEFIRKKMGEHIPEDIYEQVYEGDVTAKNLENIFYIFNNAHPTGYMGRSLSVSDIVEVDGIGTFFCDSVGFEQVYFDGSLCKWRDFHV